MGMFSGSSIDNLTLLPTDYVRRNVYYGASGAIVTPQTLTLLREQVGADKIMWGCDYPHEEGTTPQTTLALRWLLADVPEDEVRLILAGNIAKLYGFDLEALVPIAKEIGPTVTEIHTPIAPGELDGGEYFGAAPMPGGALLTRSRPVGATF
jgi:hypothetical protein